MGVGTADPKPKRLEHQRARPSYNLETSPTQQRNSVPAPVTLNWRNSGEPSEKIMNKTIKKGGESGSLEKASDMKIPLLCNEQSKTTNTCKGARIAPSRLPLTQ